MFTSTELLDAESRLLERATDETGPRVALTTLRSIARTQLPGGGMLADDQLAALASIVSSGRVVDVLVGPAGAGKTTAMQRAPSGLGEQRMVRAQSSGSLRRRLPHRCSADDLGITTENLAKWWQNHLVHGATFRAGQLVIIDEASLAGTLSLDRITALAANAGAKVLLVGDYAQLQSVDAGGAFSLLVHDRADAPELVDVHRFTHEWEKTASLGLRQGNPESIDQYIAHDRVRDGRHRGNGGCCVPGLARRHPSRQSNGADQRLERGGCVAEPARSHRIDPGWPCRCAPRSRPA